MMGALLAILLPALVMLKTTLRQKAEERMEVEFSNQVELVVSEREERLAGVIETASDLAKSDAVKRALKGELDDAGRREFSGELRSKRAGRKPVGEGGEESNLEANPLEGMGPVLCTVDMDGQIEELNPVRQARAGERRRMPLRHGQAVRRLPGLGEVDHQQVGYVIVRGREGEKRLSEVVATPVEEEGEMIGVFLMGIDAETQLDHMLTRVNRASQEETASTGFFAAGQVVQLEGLREIDRESLSTLVAEEISGEEGKSELVLEGETYRFAWQEMNPESILPSAYQIAFFPLAGVQAEISALRTKLLLVGLLALAMAVVASFLISRGLAKPVSVLEEATRRIGEGDFTARVEVGSKDELGRLAKSFNAMAEELAMKERYREVLSKVSDEAVAQSLIEGELELGGETLFLTVLFCDIREFTGLTEAMDPQGVIRLLNEHMTAMTKLVYEHRGVVDKFIGDEIMAVFGAPKSYGDDPGNAVRCALAMIEKRKELNAASEVPFEIGVGVASGKMVAGCMGSEDRLNYTVLGEPVNLAARLCGQAEPGEVLAAVTEGVAQGELLKLEMKGFRGRVSAVRVESVAEARREGADAGV